MPRTTHKLRADGGRCVCGATVTHFMRADLPDGDGCNTEGVPFNTSYYGVSLRKAEQVWQALRDQRSAWLDLGYNPQLMVLDYVEGPQYHIVWEDGSPFDWVVYFPYGGIEPEMGTKVKDVSDQTTGVFIEAENNVTMALYGDA